MLSYQQSQIVALACLGVLLLYLVGCLLPKGSAHKTPRPLGFCLYPIRKLNQRMAQRKGLVWTGLVWWSVAAFAVSLIILNSQSGFFIKLKIMAGALVPLTLCWWWRSRIRKRRQRRYALPGRRR